MFFNLPKQMYHISLLMVAHRIENGEAIMSSNGIDMTIKRYDAGGTAMIRHGWQHPPLVLLSVVALDRVKAGASVIPATHVQLIQEYRGTHGTVTQVNDAGAIQADALMSIHQ